MKILFVCLGNICRSPLAEAIAKKYAQQNSLDITIHSAGTGSWHIGEPPCEHSQKIAQLHGLDISSYQASQVTPKQCQEYDYIIGLDSSNIQNLKKIGCQKALLLGEYGYNGQDVPDPYFFDGFEGFEKVFSMIKQCVYCFLKTNVH